MTAADDFRHCREIIKTHSQSFYLAFSRLPPQRADAIFAIYAFCRQADDLVDEQQDAAGLARLRAELADFSLGRIPHTPVWRALGQVFQQFELTVAPFQELLQGVECDLDFRQPATQADLDRYCYLVAGTVGLMIAPILATRAHRQLSACAVSLGKAMQLTNILRDVGHDFGLGRVYLPLTAMEQHGYSHTDLAQQTINRQFVRLWEAEAALAEALYDQAETGFWQFDGECRPAVELSARLYRQILTTVRQRGYDCFGQRHRPPNLLVGG